MSEFPSSWAKVTLKECANINMGQSPEGKYVSENKDGIPFYQGKAEFGKIYPTPRKYCIQPTKIAQKNDILLSIRAPVGPTNICPEESCIGRGLAGIRAYEGLSQQYLLNYFKHIEPWLSQQGTGSTFKAISGGFLSDVEVLIAPLKEQIRIADKLDSVLAKVDEAQARLEKIPTLLKRFRQSILAAATSGELTREWRGYTEFGKTVSIGELTSDIRYGTSKKCFYGEGNTAVLRIPNIGDGKIDTSDLKYADFDKDEKEKLILKKGDILIIRSNGSVDLVGKAALVSDKDTNYLYAGYLIRIRFKDESKVNPKYVLFCLQSPSMRHVVELNARSTSGINNINSKELAALELDLPDLVEQTEIVRRVESLLSQADAVEKQYRAAKQRLDRLSQALLAKAFRGELVPQDPNDEPAAELLKRIQAERQQAADKPKRKTGKRDNQTNTVPNLTKTNIMQLKDAPETYLLDLLAQLGGESHAEVLWKKTELTIDDFYAKLKQEMLSNRIVEDKSSPDPAMRKLKVANR